MLSIFELCAVLLTLSAALGLLNYKILRLPHSIGLLLMGVATSLILVAIDAMLPDRHVYAALNTALLKLDFRKIVMDGMLAFLLFAGALHVDLGRLRQRAGPVIVLATVGTALSTALVGVAIWQVTALAGQPMGLAWSLVFGALISPTDPVAVLSTLRNVKVPVALEAELQGEALFNDGVGIVLFTILLAFATQTGGAAPTAASIVGLLLWEAGGGLLLGLFTGYLAYRAMRLLDDYPIEVLISLSLVTATYALAQRLGMSAPLAVVAAGLLIGNRAPKDAMSSRTQTYIFGLWTLIDEILNSVLFLLIGLEVLVLQFQWQALLIAPLAIPLVIGARFVAVGLPALLPGSRRLMMCTRNVPFLTWAGVRGGISVALVLSVPDSPAKSLMLAATYAVVLFSMIFQGLTLGLVARRTVLAQVDESFAGGDQDRNPA